MLKKELLLMLFPLCVGGGLGFIISESQTSDYDDLSSKNEILQLTSDVKRLQASLETSQLTNKSLTEELKTLNSEFQTLQEQHRQLQISKNVEKQVTDRTEVRQVELEMNVVEVKKDESIEGVEKELQPVTLVSGLRNMEKVDPNKIDRQVERIMKERLKDLELDEEAKESIENLLVTYYEEQNELNYMVLDPNVPTDVILQKIQDLHLQTVTDLNQHVQYDVAESMIASNKGEQHQKLVSQFFGKYKRYKLDDSREEEIKTVVDEYIVDHPYLAFATRNRMTPNFSIDTTYEEIEKRREYVGETNSLSELMKKSVELKKQAQLELYERMNLNLDQHDHDAFLQSLEMEERRSQRPIHFFERLENEPGMVEAYIKISSGMRSGGERSQR